MRVFGLAFVHRLILRCNQKALPHALELLQAILHGHRGLVVPGFEQKKDLIVQRNHYYLLSIFSTKILLKVK